MTKRYFILLLIVLVLTLGAGTVAGCSDNLPEKTEENFFALAYEAGYSWGYQLTEENKDREDLFWTPPDKVDEAQKFNPKVNIRDYYIPKGYWTMGDVGNAQFLDGTPFNDKQKKQALEANNWGFYSGFMRGSKDYLEGKSPAYLR